MDGRVCIIKLNIDGVQGLPCEGSIRIVQHPILTMMVLDTGIHAGTLK